MKTLWTFLQRVIIFWLVVVLLTGVTTHPLLAATYYVNAATGADARSATEAQNEDTPWKTLTRATSALSLAAGDVIQVGAGTYDAGNGETFPITPVDGVAILGSGSSDTAVVASAANAFETSGDYLEGFWLGDMTVRSGNVGLSIDLNGAQVKTTVDGVVFGGGASGIEVLQDSGDGALAMTVSNSTFDGLGLGLGLFASSASTTNLDLTVENSTFSDLEDSIDAIFSSASDVNSRVTIEHGAFDQCAYGPWVYVNQANVNAKSELTVSNSTFTGMNSSALTVTFSSLSASSAESVVNIFDSDFTGSNYIGLYGWYLRDMSAAFNYTVSGNTFSQSTGTALSMVLLSFSNADTDVNARVLDNTFTDTAYDAIDYYEAYGYYGTQNTDLTLRGNSISNTSGKGILLSFYDLFYYDSKTVDAKILENDISQPGSDGISVYSEYMEEGDALHNGLTLAGNTITNATTNGIYVAASENSSNNLLDFDWTVVNNTVTASGGYGIYMEASYLNSANEGRGRFTVAGNTIDGTGEYYDGITLSISSWYDSRVAQEVTVGGNTVTNAGDVGIGVDLSDQSNLTSNIVRIEDNVVTNSASDGISIDTDDYDGGTHVTISGNTLTDNGGNGLYLSGTTLDYNHVPFDVGGGALGSPGNNIFTGNGSYAIELDAPNTDDAAIMAHNNYFGTTDPAAIDEMIYDNSDNSYFEVLDASNPLENPPSKYGATANLEAEIVNDTGAEGLTTGDVLRMTATLNGTGELGCRTAWFAASIPEKVTPVPGAAETSLGAILDYSPDGLDVAVGYVPVTRPVTITWDMLVGSDKGCGDLVVDAILTCTGETANDIVVPADTLAVTRLQFTAYTDNDHDGFGQDGTDTFVCGALPEGTSEAAGDCDDTSSAVNPDATEICNTIDDDCDGKTDEGVTTTFYTDSDLDGYGDAYQPIQACKVATGLSESRTDCDDDVASTHPGANEVCDEVDNDCDKSVDEGVTTTYYLDRDEDGHGDAETPVEACALETGIAASSDDCNDRRDDINPDATEICDGLDNDCNDEIDENLGDTFYQDSDGDGYGNAASSTLACTQPAGYSTDATDCDDSKADVHPGATEVPDGLDNDCSGVIDDNLDTADTDGDGVSAADGDCAPDDPAIYLGATETADGKDNDCDGRIDEDTEVSDDDHDGVTEANGDCNDADATVYPGAPEITDSKDNDCDTAIDEDVDTSDDDEDGKSEADGDCNDGDTTVYPGADEVADGKDNNCNGQIDEGTDWADDDGDGYSEQDGDCNDADPAINPAATDICDEVDNDCDNGQEGGGIDEDINNVWYLDGDSDGYGVDNSTQLACAQPTGFAAVSGDCDDTKAAVNPGATEVCDGIDNDCDADMEGGGIDEAGSTYYADSDGDSHGDAANMIVSCSPGSGFVTSSDDCNDRREDIYPGADEVCDGADNDCDNQVDEDGATTFYVDDDDDGFGDSTNSVEACELTDGYSARGGDCDDGDKDVFPGAAEVCDGVDNDCDKSVDEDGDTAFFTDSDGDGYGDAATLVLACSASTGLVDNAEDCDDADAEVNPDAEEVCDDIDNNCDGAIDDVDGCDGEVSPSPMVVDGGGGGGCECNSTNSRNSDGVWMGLIFAGLLLRRRKRS